MTRYAVSACLAGIACRYDGGHNLCLPVARLVKEGRAVPVCPECLGGLPTPRCPSELRGRRVVSRAGQDVTAAFQRGARMALEAARLAGCTAAILKKRSPSCGVGSVYDGTFRHVLREGDGVWAALLRREGFALFSEDALPEGCDGP